MNTDILFLVIMFIVFITAMAVSFMILIRTPLDDGNRKVTGYVCASLNEIGKREEQQDALWFSHMEESKDCLAVVADGMGGLKNGGIISEIIATQMKNAFFAPDRLSEPVQFLQHALWVVNENVNAYLDTCGNDNGGSTIVAAYISGQKLYYLSVGDSRIYLIHNHTITKLNLEHNFGNELDDLARRGMISFDEARQNRQRAALTSYVGMGDITKIDGNVEPILLEKGDVILLMSDGVFGTLDDCEILACTDFKKSRGSKKQKDSEFCEQLVCRIKQQVEGHGKMKQDNYSVVAIRLI